MVAELIGRGEPDELRGLFRGSASGHTISALKHAVHAGRVVRVRRDLYVPAELWRADDRSPDAARERLRIASIAAALALRGAAASHRSAAALAGVPLWSWSCERPCVTVCPGREALADSLHVHRARMPAHHRERGVVARLTIARTVLDIAREHGIRDAVVAGDYALANAMTTTDELRRVAADCRRFPGIRRARGIIELLDGRSESPLESVSRLVLARLPVPTPTPQVDIYDANGRFLGRADFYWDALGIVGEVDGKAKYDEAAALWNEKRRQDDLTDAGLLVVRWGKPELDEPGLLLRKLREAQSRALGRRPDERRWRTRP